MFVNTYVFIMKYNINSYAFAYDVILEVELQITPNMEDGTNFTNKYHECYIEIENMTTIIKR